MMIEDLLTEISVVPYEVACRLKELGFPQETLLSYVKTMSPENSEDLYLPHLEFFGAVKGDLFLPEYEVVAAPSITSVLAWIYDKYSVNIYAKANSNTSRIELFEADRQHNHWGYVIQDLSPRAKFIKEDGADVPLKYTPVDLKEIDQTLFNKQTHILEKDIRSSVALCGIVKFLSLI